MEGAVAQEGVTHHNMGDDHEEHDHTPDHDHDHDGPALPDRAQLEHLVELYFVHVHPMIPVVQKHEFMQAFNDVQVSSLSLVYLLSSMCTIAYFCFA